MTTESVSVETLAVAMDTMAERLFQMGGTIGADEHGFRNMGDQLAGWAADVRQLGARCESLEAKIAAVQDALDDVRGTSNPVLCWAVALEAIAEAVDE